MTVFAMFWIQLATMRFTGKRPHQCSLAPPSSDALDETSGPSRKTPASSATKDPENAVEASNVSDTDSYEMDPDSFTTQLTSIVILDLGIIFHSVFIGLTLAVSGDEFDTLYVVLVFHQTFEGLAVGSRLASVPWPEKTWTPYLLGLGYALSTPVAIAVGLGVRQSFAPGSQTTLIVNGVFDSIAAGNLIYTGLVELMAHDFLFCRDMREASHRRLGAATAMMALGAGLMVSRALLCCRPFF